MKNKNQRPVCVLVDNGSLKPEPTLHLRGLASDLEDELSVPVHPVSLLHSSKVDSSLLMSFITLPLDYFGRSYSLYSLCSTSAVSIMQLPTTE